MINPEYVNDATIDLIGLYDVTRWGVIKTLRHQSVAEHTFGVMVLVTNLAHRLNANAIELHEAMMWAMVHDAPETLTGDIDGKFKRDNPVMRAAILDAEKRSFPWYAAEAAMVVPAINALVKVADKLETIWYIRTWGKGPRADAVGRELTDILFNEAVPKLEQVWRADMRELDGISIADEVKDLLDHVMLESNCVQFRR